MGAAEDLGLGGVVESLDPFGVVETVSGQGAAKAAKDAARLQAGAGAEARDIAEAAQFRLEEGLQPFAEFGVDQGIGQLPGLFEQQQAAISDPTSGVLNNPFFQALAQQQEQRLLNVQGSRGKGFSGGTEDALNRNLLLLGNQFSQQNIGNIQGQIQNQFNAANIGQSSAAQVGVSGLNTAGNIGGILGNVANAQAAGVIGQQQAQAQGINNIIGIGSGLAGGGGGFSDQRLKTNIEFSHVHPSIGVNIYTWDWTEEAKAIVGDQDETGPIAQELRLTRPDLVITDPATGFLKVLM
ncbi:MAG: tail fiber domain-containing protein [Flavobacteriales bacterium]|nr:tail fiber domain-containing protein [Flavobacteriales bacterium]